MIPIYVKLSRFIAMIKNEKFNTFCNRDIACSAFDFRKSFIDFNISDDISLTPSLNAKQKMQTNN